MTRTIIKTINRTGKKITKSSLVIRAKKQTESTKKKMAEINENIKAKKLEEVEEEQEALRIIKAGGEEKKVPQVTIKKKYKLSIGIKDMFEAGCHLGHRSSKTSPKAKKNIYDTRKGVEIFDLPKTIHLLELACTYLFNLADQGQKVVLVGTKRQAREVVKRIAIETKMPYVTSRWLGGTITNWDQIKLNIKKLNEISEGMERGRYSDLTKKEQSELNKEMIRLERMVGGLTKLDRLPIAVFVVGVNHEKTAIAEAKQKGLKTIGICDSDTSPGLVDFPIVCNDDNVKSISLVVEEIGKALKGKS